MTVLENVCDDIADRYVRFVQYPDVFVKKDDRVGLRANVTGECHAVRALHSLCARIVDDHETLLKERLMSRGDIPASEWTKAVCENGIVREACSPAADPGLASEIVESVRKSEADAARTARTTSLDDSAGRTTGTSEAKESADNGHNARDGGSSGEDQNNELMSTIRREDL